MRSFQVGPYQFGFGGALVVNSFQSRVHDDGRGFSVFATTDDQITVQPVQHCVDLWLHEHNYDLGLRTLYFMFSCYSRAGRFALRDCNIGGARSRRTNVEIGDEETRIRFERIRIAQVIHFNVKFRHLVYPAQVHSRVSLDLFTGNELSFHQMFAQGPDPRVVARIAPAPDAMSTDVGDDFDVQNSDDAVDETYSHDEDLHDRCDVGVSAV